MDPMPSDVFARRLRAERERRGLSQAALARRMAALLGQNVEPTAITRIEQQMRAVRLDEAVCAAEVLDVPLTVLLNEDAGRDNEELLQQSLADLALAERRWEEQRIEIARIVQTIQQLSTERDALHAYRSRIARPGIAVELDPSLVESIDARVPVDPDD